MDSHQQTRLAQQQDPELAARIVRSIGDLERDYLFAWGPLSERLLRELAAAARKSAPGPWVVEGSDEGFVLALPAWKSTRGVGRDAWLELADAVEDEDEHSWVAAAVGAGPTKLCLALMFRPGLVPIAEALTPNDKHIAALLKDGFEQDETGNRLFLPIGIEAELLAQGFELNDLEEALAPLRRAVELISASSADLDAIIEHVRAQAKRK